MVGLGVAGAAALGAPPGPSPARGSPATRGHTPGQRVRYTAAGAGGSVTRSAHPRGVTHPRTAAHTRGPYSVTGTIHIHTPHRRPLIRGHAGPDIQSGSRSHTPARGPALKPCPTASHAVKHSNCVTAVHVESYTSTHVPRTVAHFRGIAVPPTHMPHTAHTLLHTQTCSTLTWETHILHCRTHVTQSRVTNNITTGTPTATLK